MGSLSTLKEADQQLIRLLADGQFRSGSQLGDVLGVSRAAVWKRAQRLNDFGLALESVKGKGYRLAQPVELLDPDFIQEQLTQAGFHVDLHYSLVTDSTNADALAGTSSAGQSAIFLAECQLAGRGRRGRQWQSPFAANHYLSVRYPIQGGFAALGGLSLAVGVAVADALVSLQPGLPVGLKWPNDLLVNGAKLGGVLIELAGEMDGRVDVVVGVGLNGRMTPAQAERIDQRWTDLASVMGEMPSRTQVTTEVLSRLLTMLAEFSTQGFEPLVSRYDVYDQVAGKRVQVQSAEQMLSGVAVGVSSDGALRLETAEGLKELYGGEVSLRIQ
ncbi:bifunctional biotin--[acetyl-CoA-carboxylase] ligase/biotin operon repressor BirA [Alcanivorax sp. DP30]|nr:bifunctional biotin--[acetyl-CoA-carboxylase] ligase/biotin operon repressor BirA [Alcanivorax sp. DP30]